MACQLRAAFGALVDDRPSALAAHALDAWPLSVKRARLGQTAGTPAAVVRPTSTDEVAAILRWAGAAGVPVVPWGGGSSVTGAPLPTDAALVLDTTSLRAVIALDPVSGRVRVGAGMLGGDLEERLGDEGLTTHFSPQSLLRSTVGGWVATRASGQWSSRWGGIEDAVVGLTVVLASGEVLAVGSAPRGAVGPDLVSLFTGSEGALGVITEVELRVHPAEPLRELAAYALPDVEAGIAVMRDIVRVGLRPAMLRLYDPDEARHLAVDDPGADAVLLCGFHGPPSVTRAEHEVASELAAAAGGRSLGPAPVEAWLERRFDFSRIEGLLDEPGGYAETIEVAHGWRDIVGTHTAMRQALAPLADEVLGHFSHAYADGTSLYVIVTGHAADDGEAVARIEAIWDAAMTVALEHGAVISHHHGIGRARAPYLRDQLGAGHDVLRRVKAALDPAGTLHPESLGLVP